MDNKTTVTQPTERAMKEPKDMTHGELINEIQCQHSLLKARDPRFDMQRTLALGDEINARWKGDR